ncbi:hypothetical protein PR048_003314 [Dryococelus australis]|uniref:Integrase catalytic domain-containing protein n=1 Tax=Dryococelus australis TaxID=614101 RepID=A0ABQ9IMS7_9NEOP|nr:hypothetical protein PR048_003314 [Dryococelus australis]
MDEFRVCIEAVWAEIPQAYIISLFLSMPHRVTAVIAACVGVTNYGGKYVNPSWQGYFSLKNTQGIFRTAWKPIRHKSHSLNPWLLDKELTMMREKLKKRGGGLRVARVASGVMTIIFWHSADKMIESSGYDVGGLHADAQYAMMSGLRARPGASAGETYRVGAFVPCLSGLCDSGISHHQRFLHKEREPYTGAYASDTPGYRRVWFRIEEADSPLQIQTCNGDEHWHFFLSKELEDENGQGVISYQLTRPHQEIAVRWKSHETCMLDVRVPNVHSIYNNDDTSDSNINVCGAQISCFSEKGVKQIEDAGVQLPVLPVPKLKILRVTSRARTFITRHTTIRLEGIGKPNAVALLIVKGLAKENILGTDFLTTYSVKLDFGDMTVSLPKREPNRWEPGDKFASSLSRDIDTHILQVNGANTSYKAREEDIWAAIAAVEAVTSLNRISCALRSKSFQANHFTRYHIQFHKKYMSEAEDREAIPYSNPFVCIQKHDGTVRLCLDARALNKITIKVRESPEQTSKVLRLYRGVKFVSTFDLSCDFRQIPLDTFGICNAIAEFTIYLALTLLDSCASCARSYVDDILITSSTYEEHLEHLNTVLTKLQQVGMTVKLRKSVFCRDELTFLGCILMPTGIKTVLDKLKAITQFPTPKSVKLLSSFLGVIGFYRNYPNKVAQIAVPLFELLKYDQVWRWIEVEQGVFEGLKDLFVREHVINHPVQGQERICIRGELQTIVPSRPLQMVSVDLFGLLPKSKGGIRYIFFLMDIFTKFTQLYAIVNATANRVVSKIKSYMEEVFKPEVVLSNKGTQFTRNADIGSSIYYCFCKSPSGERNPVERCMHTLGATLRTYCSSSQQRWRDLLPLVELVMNHTVHVSMSMTPFEALTGQRSMLLDKVRIPQLSDVLDEKVEILAETRLFSIAEKYKQKLKTSKLSKFDIGSLVLVKTNPKRRFWTNKGNCYGLRDRFIKEFVRWYNIASLRKFYKPVIEARSLVERRHRRSRTTQVNISLWKGGSRLIHRCPVVSGFHSDTILKTQTNSSSKPNTLKYQFMPNTVLAATNLEFWARWDGRVVNSGMSCWDDDSFRRVKSTEGQVVGDVVNFSRWHDVHRQLQGLHDAH